MMMTLLITLGLLASTVLVVLSRTRVRHTTLTHAWKWALAAMLCWNGLWWGDRVLNLLPKGVLDQLWYLQAVLMLVPLIDVLGARSPTHRVWPMFVLLPMMLVLTWPVWVAWITGQSGLELELPSVLAYSFVLIMGAGNYFGTRFTGSTLLLGIALALLVGAVSATAPAAFPEAETARNWAGGLLTLATFWMSFRGIAVSAPHSETPSSLHRYSVLWEDFRDLFGIVWAKRALDRINQMAAKENWKVRLELYGLIAEQEPTPETLARIDHTFRWLLRRFAEPEWIDDRLGKEPTTDHLSTTKT